MNRRFFSLLFAVVLCAGFVLGRALPADEASLAAAAPVPPTTPGDRLKSVGAIGSDTPSGGGGTCTGSSYTTNVSNFDFAPTSYAEQYVNTELGLSAFSEASFIAPFRLPTGACLASVTFFVVDNTADAIEVAVGYRRLSGATPVILVVADSAALPQTDSPQEVQLGVDAVTDQVTDVYFLDLTLRSGNFDHRLLGARVTYTLPVTFLPTIRK